MIQFLDMKAIQAAQADDLRAAFDRVLASGWFIMGDELAAFERDYAAFCEAEHAVGVANGLDALSLGLRALGIGSGDEVIVPANTYIASWLAVTHVGAIPVPVEPDEATYNLDPTRLAAAISPRTRAIMPVHLYGQPADLDPILALAKAHGLAVLEDAAQAHGAKYRGRRIGSHGTLVAWSFYPGKNLGALGDGGSVTTDDGDLADRLRVLRNYGSRVKYHNEVVGYNSRLDELQAALLHVKLARLDVDNARRSEVAAAYSAALPGSRLILPVVPAWANPAWHLFVVRHPERDAFADRLRAAGVATVIHYPVPPHLQPAYRTLGFGSGSFPISERIHREVISLPIGPTMSDADVAQVIDAVRAAA